MDTKHNFLNNSLVQIGIALLITAVATYFFVEVWKLSKNKNEGFFAGPVKGSGIPDCLRTSSQAGRLYEIFNSRKSTTEEGPDDLREFTLLLSKLACLKKDLMSDSGFVDATRYQPYSTSHDIEPIAETTARCLAKTIPERDLSISFDKWSSRGNDLIRRLCTNINLTPAEISETDRLFKALIDDVSDIAMSKCLKGVAQIAGTTDVREVGGYEPSTIKDLGTYKGYY